MAENTPKYFYLNLQAAGIIGNCQKANYLQWIEVDSWSFSMTQPAQPVVGGGAPKGSMATGTFSFSMKHAGPQIFKNVASGAHITGPSQFKAERGGLQQGTAVGGDPYAVYLELDFSDYAITSRNLGGDSGQKQENVSLSFSTVALTYTQLKAGSLGTSTTKTYDVKQNAVY